MEVENSESVSNNDAHSHSLQQRVGFIAGDEMTGKTWHMEPESTGSK